MCWILLLLLFWLSTVACTYMIFYYESANGAHLKLLRSKGSLPSLLLKGFFGTLYSQLLLVILTFTVLHRRFWQLPSGPVDKTPIVFIHGLYHNRTAWYLYLRWFRKWGWQYVKAINLTGKFRSIEDYTQILAREIDEILAETGSSKADLVGHSMGGLIIRFYLTENSAKAKVRKVVTLGSPHAGSKLGVFGIGKAVKEMLPGSPFLETLNQAEIQVPQAIGFYSIYSIVDNMVLPNESAILTGGGVKNIETRTVNHVGLVFCKHTARLVRQCLVEP